MSQNQGGPPLSNDGRTFADPQTEAYWLGVAQGQQVGMPIPGQASAAAQAGGPIPDASSSAAGASGVTGQPTTGPGVDGVNSPAVQVPDDAYRLTENMAIGDEFVAVAPDGTVVDSRGAGTTIHTQDGLRIQVSENGRIGIDTNFRNSANVPDKYDLSPVDSFNSVNGTKVTTDEHSNVVIEQANGQRITVFDNGTVEIRLGKQSTDPAGGGSGGVPVAPDDPAPTGLDNPSPEPLPTPPPGVGGGEPVPTPPGPNPTPPPGGGGGPAPTLPPGGEDEPTPTPPGPAPTPPPGGGDEPTPTPPGPSPTPPPGGGDEPPPGGGGGEQPPPGGGGGGGDQPPPGGGGGGGDQPPPGGGGGGGDQPPPGGGGGGGDDSSFEVDFDHLKDDAGKWTALAEDAAILANCFDDLKSAIDKWGLWNSCKAPYDSACDLFAKQLRDGERELKSMATGLEQAMKQYQNADDQNAATADAALR